jgi:Zn-finger nucleic acid-binding protein
MVTRPILRDLTLTTARIGAVMRCLNCDTEMMNYEVVTRSAKLSYDVCEKCGSLWLDRGELDKMAFQVAGSIEFCSEEEADIAARPPRTCPPV